jgi:hypothetical protein
VIRALLILALAAPLSLFVLVPSPPASPHAIPAKETDLRRVYARLSEECLYRNFHEWCGLRVSDATPDEAAHIRQAVRLAPDPKSVWLGPLAGTWARVFPDGVRPKERVRWYRLSHPTDPAEWIGIGVCEQYNTGWTAYWIACRVAVGFEQWAEQAAAPDPGRM